MYNSFFLKHATDVLTCLVILPQLVVTERNAHIDGCFSVYCTYKILNELVKILSMENRAGRTTCLSGPAAFEIVTTCTEYTRSRKQKL